MLKLQISLVDVIISRSLQTESFSYGVSSGGNSVILPQNSRPVDFEIKSLNQSLEIFLEHQGLKKASASVLLQYLFVSKDERTEIFALQPLSGSNRPSPSKNPIQVELQFNLVRAENEEGPKTVICSRCGYLETVVKDLEEELTRLNEPLISEIENELLDDDTEQLKKLMRSLEFQIENEEQSNEQNETLSQLLKECSEARQKTEEAVQDAEEFQKKQFLELEKKIEEAIKEKEEANYELKREINENSKLRNRIEILEEICEDLKKELKFTEEERDVAQEMKDPKEDLQSFDMSSTSYMDTDAKLEFESRIKEITAIIEKEQKEKQLLFEKNQELRNELSQLGKIKEELDSELKVANDKIVDEETEIKETKHKNSLLNNEILKLQSEIKLLNQEIENIKAELTHSRSENQEQHLLIQSLKSEKLDLNKTLRETEDQNEQKMLENNHVKIELQQALDEISQLKAEYQANMCEMQQNQADLQSNYEEAIKSLKKEILDLNSHHASICDSYKETILKLEEKIEELYKIIEDLNKKLSVEQTALEQSEREKESLGEELNRLNMKIEVYKDIDSLIDQLNKENEVYKSENKELENQMNSMAEILSLQSKRNQTIVYKLQTTENELEKTKSELETTTNTLKETSNTLFSTEEALKSKNSELEKALFNLNEKEIQLQETNENLKSAKEDLSKAERELKITKDQLETEYELHEEALNNKQAEIDRLLAGNKKPDYIPIKDDEVDGALADYLNNCEKNIKVNFVREDTGIYSFGTKRVFIKVQQGNIIIRVGGGYMLIDEFIDMYTVGELEKYAKEETKNNHPLLRGITNKFSGSVSPPRASSPNKVIKTEVTLSESQGGFTTMYGVAKRPPSPTRTKTMRAPELGGLRRSNSVSDF